MIQIFEDNETFCNKCIEAKNKIFDLKNAKNIWSNNFNTSNKVGEVANILDEVKPINAVDFFKKYIVNHNGRSVEELTALSLAYKNEVEKINNVNLSLELYFYYILYHIIYETYLGLNYEEELCNFLISNYNSISKIEKSETLDDRRYGVDRIITLKNGSNIFLQIKPNTFFLTREYTNLTAYIDRFGMIIKYFKSIKYKGIKTYYSVYKKDKEKNIKWITNSRNKLLLDINDIFCNVPNIIDGISITNFFNKDYKLDSNINDNIENGILNLYTFYDSLYQKYKNRNSNIFDHDDLLIIQKIMRDKPNDFFI